MDILTKENFWNDLLAKYKAELNEFFAWVDQYKKKVGWDKLFTTAKYHDLPIAMQLGIFIQYTIETKHRYQFIENMPETMQEWAKQMQLWFENENWYVKQDKYRFRDAE